jgi:acetyl esterase
VASLIAKTMQRLVMLADRRPSGRGSAAASRARLPEFPRAVSELTIPTAVAPARVVVYRPTTEDPAPPVHVNFHGGGFILPVTETDDAFCRAVAALAGVVVVNVDYAVAPQYPFPAPPRQSYDVVRWIAENGAEHGWDGTRLTVGGQSRVLAAGDAYYFSSATPHRFRNVGREVCEIISASTPPTF